MKRSHAVVAVLAAATVGTAAYSMAPSQRCTRADGGAAVDPASPSCRSGGGSGGSGGSYSRGARPLFGSADSGAPTSTKASPSVGTTRGGFGSFFSSLGSNLSRGT